jgi:hypothetical protein
MSVMRKLRESTVQEGELLISFLYQIMLLLHLHFRSHILCCISNLLSTWRRKQNPDVVLFKNWSDQRSPNSLKCSSLSISSQFVWVGMKSRQSLLLSHSLSQIACQHSFFGNWLWRALHRTAAEAERALWDTWKLWLKGPSCYTSLMS